MRDGHASRTAEHNALFRALESDLPESRRLFDDPLARGFLTWPFTVTTWLAAVPGLGHLVPRFIDNRWPGVRASVVARTRLIDEAIIADTQRLRPDAVVLDLSRNGSRELGEKVRALAPETKVILLADDESRMEILGPAGAKPRRIDTAVSDALLSELRPRQATAERT